MDVFFVLQTLLLCLRTIKTNDSVDIPKNKGMAILQQIVCAKCEINT